MQHQQYIIQRQYGTSRSSSRVHQRLTVQPGHLANVSATELSDLHAPAAHQEVQQLLQGLLWLLVADEQQLLVLLSCTLLLSRVLQLLLLTLPSVELGVTLKARGWV